MSQIPYSNKRYSVKCICEMNVNSCKCILFEHVKMHLLTIIVTSFSFHSNYSLHVSFSIFKSKSFVTLFLDYLAAVTRDSPLPERKITRLSKPGSPSAASTGSNTSSSGSNQNVSGKFTVNYMLCKQ